VARAPSAPTPANAGFAQTASMADWGKFQWTVNENYLDFEISGQTNGWVSFGVQGNQNARVSMANSDVFVCAITDDGDILFTAWNMVSKSASDILNQGERPELAALVSNIEGEEVGGSTICRGRLDISGDSKMATLIRTSAVAVKVLMAHGDGDEISYHNDKSGASLDFAQKENDSGYEGDGYGYDDTYTYSAPSTPGAPTNQDQSIQDINSSQTSSSSLVMTVALAMVTFFLL